MTAEEALAAASRGQAQAKRITDMAENDTTGNGFPGFTAIWEKVWGVAQGVLNPQPTIASSDRLAALERTSASTQNMLMGGAALVGGYLLLTALTKKKRGRR